jgi:chemotaxis family two-component system response regulator PixG
MNIQSYQTISPDSTEKLPKFSPINILAKIIKIKATGYLVVSSNSVTWRIYVHSGELIYANHSLDSFERLERHLRRLSYEVSSLTGAVRNQVRLKFENEGQTTDVFPPEYQAIGWLLEQKYLQDFQVADLINALNQEVFESFLLLKTAQYKFIKKTELYPQLVRLNLEKIIIRCNKKIENWQALAPLIASPEQRPYFFSKNQSEGKLSSEQIKKFSKLLRGFNFRQLAVLTNQDEIKVAQYIYKFILNKNVVVRAPQAPYDKLPQIAEKPNARSKNHQDVAENNNLNSLNLPSNEKKTYKLVCVDDSPTILKEISRFLDKEDLSIQAINDSKRALLEIIRFNPNIILLDVGMPGIDGYQLCQLIRNHHLFKTTPIIMVTGNRGLIDRAKARVAGASDYLTKPFTQSDLLKMVFRYLT